MTLSLNAKKPITVIVVDDDKNIVDVFAEFLELEGFIVVGKAYEGNTAAMLYAKLKPDIVFLDVMMPQYDGIYALQKIREISPKSNVIMVTADLRQETAQKLKELNASAIVYKPFEIEEIMSIVNKLTFSDDTILQVIDQRMN